MLSAVFCGLHGGCVVLNSRNDDSNVIDGASLRCSIGFVNVGYFQVPAN
jgi:hypothetical protein